MPHTNRQKITRILLVDDHAMIREGLGDAIARESDLMVCGGASDARQALALAASEHPHLAIVDLTLKNSSGLDLIKQLLAQQPGLLILVLSMHDESLYAERVIRAGAKGYMNKAEATRDLFVAVRKILAGEIYLSEVAARHMAVKSVGQTQAKSISNVEQLTDRELEILRRLGDGQNPRQIAAELHLDTSTVETYRSRLKEKLRLKDANDLLQFAIRWNKSLAK